MSMKSLRPNSVSARLAIALLAIVSVARPATPFSSNNPYSPNNPFTVAERELQKVETNAVTFDPQSPERNVIEGRAQQLRTQMAESFLIYGAGVKKPGLYQPKPGLTVTEAIKLAGGTTPDADGAHIRLTFKSNRLFERAGVRSGRGQVSGANLDLADIIREALGCRGEALLPVCFNPAASREEAVAPRTQPSAQNLPRSAAATLGGTKWAISPPWRAACFTNVELQ